MKRTADSGSRVAPRRGLFLAARHDHAYHVRAAAMAYSQVLSSNFA